MGNNISEHESSVIYMLISPTGKCYIGQTIYSFRKRWNQHKNCANNGKNGCRYLNNAIRKYGANSFYYRILHKCDISDLDKWEAFYINLYNTLTPNGYNLIVGGNSNKLYSSDTKNYMCKSQREYHKDNLEYTKDLPTYISLVRKNDNIIGYRVANSTNRKEMYFCNPRITIAENKNNALLYLKTGETQRKLPKFLYETENGYRVDFRINNKRVNTKRFENQKISLNVRFDQALAYLTSLHNKYQV